MTGNSHFAFARTTLTRDAAPSDIPRLIVMIRQLAAHHDDIASVDEATLSNDIFGPRPWIYVTVAERADGLVGYAALCPLIQLQFGIRGVDMHHLFVDRPFRSRGIGRALIDASKRRAFAEGCSYMTVSTHPDNADAQAVYAACGFEPRHSLAPRFAIKLE